MRGGGVFPPKAQASITHDVIKTEAWRSSRTTRAPAGPGDLCLGHGWIGAPQAGSR